MMKDILQQQASKRGGTVGVLKTIPKVSYLAFSSGDIEIIFSSSVSIVGSRYPRPPSYNFLKAFVKDSIPYQLDVSPQGFLTDLAEKFGFFQILKWVTINSTGPLSSKRTKG